MRIAFRLLTLRLFSLAVAAGFSVTGAAGLKADGPKDNNPAQVARIPKAGVKVPDAVRADLEGGLKSLGEQIEKLEQSKNQVAKAHLADVQIFYKAVHDALKYDEFFDPGEFSKATELLKIGVERATALAKGDLDWATSSELTVRGYVSKLDGSVQPYGIVLPSSYTTKTGSKYRLDIWLHGRGETLSEVNFLHDHLHSRGEFTPPDTIVMHPYGRFCNAFKFAGEVDVLEALDSAKANYRADEDLVAIRGFSMGGAGVWHLTVHYPGLWFASNPGAGFSETPDFLKVFQNEMVKPTAWEKTLYRMYDCPYYVGNLRHVPTVAYSGADDRQKQAADVMEKACEKEGIRLRHVIGPHTQHAYQADAKRTVIEALASLAQVGRERYPSHIDFTTQTLKYNTVGWVTIEGLGEHWQSANVEGDFDQSDITLKTDNVTDLKLEFAPGWSQFALDTAPILTVDDEELSAPKAFTDRSWNCSLYRENDRWHVGARPAKGLRKLHNLQGPIDDAFMEPFLIVKPTGKARNEATEKWVQSEMRRAIEQWRTQFRGEPRVKDDKDVTESDIADRNLILWGDPQSNQTLAKIADKLPIEWGEKEIKAGKQKFDSTHSAIIMIYPNPLNPNRYVVLNSGFTFREFAYLNNARQVPKLPDWAVIDLNTPPDSLWPGKVSAADFFDESWKLK